jgi:hypothetical protein
MKKAHKLVKIQYKSINKKNKNKNKEKKDLINQNINLL